MVALREKIPEEWNLKYRSSPKLFLCFEDASFELYVAKVIIDNLFLSFKWYIFFSSFVGFYLVILPNISMKSTPKISAICISISSSAK